MDNKSIITRMIERLLANELTRLMRTFPAVGLLGPRQIGKTTLAKAIAADANALYLDLENPADLEKLTDPRGYLQSRHGRLVVLDEVQRVPGLFQVLRGVIDERIELGEPTGQFLLLGSASNELLRQSGESLAGRIAYIELSSLDAREVASADQDRLWIRGGFPRAFLADDEEASAVWREQFIRTYLERDVPALGPRIPAETLRRFWTMLAHGQGGLLNAANLARSLAVDGKTVAKYLDLMVDLLLVRRLPPFHTNARKRLVKSPKVYVRDSGIVHTLLRLDDEESVLGHPVAGKSWEGFAIETLLRASPSRTRASFYRTATGVEADLVLELPRSQLWAIEFKRGIAPRTGRGLATALEDLQPDRAFIVNTSDERYPVKAGVEAIGLREMAGELARL